MPLPLLDLQHEAGPNATAVLGRRDPLLLAHLVRARRAGAVLRDRLEDRPPAPAAPSPKATLQGPIGVAIARNAGGGPPAQVSLSVSGSHRPGRYYFAGEWGGGPENKPTRVRFRFIYVQKFPFSLDS